MSGAITVLEQCLKEGYRITAEVVEERAPVSSWGSAVLDRP
jgi:ribulose bisphosphate carboxylase small subunit